tara:strand:+ start:1298 stop:1993 length:696 start_codon:yes stop_codon:yes gene_type:complete
MRLSWRWVSGLIIVISASTLVVWLINEYPDVLIGRDGGVDLVRSLLWLGLIVGSLFLHKRLKIGHIVKYGGIWFTIGVCLILAYSFRHDARDIIGRITAELFPEDPRAVGEVIEVRAGSHGHFVLKAEIDGVTIRFLVDTGASDVMLSMRDASQLGLIPEKLVFNKFYSTANGLVKGAPVRIKRMTIGPISITNVSASVNAGEMKQSLLGMSFLNRLSGFEVRDGILRLKP